MGRILIADDEAEVTVLLDEILGEWGYEVATVATGAEALSTVATFRPHVIVIDMAMPRLSGPEVLKALRRDGVTVPVIFITGNEFAQAEGCFAVVSKPFDFRRLAEVMTAAMAESQATTA